MKGSVSATPGRPVSRVTLFKLLRRMVVSGLVFSLPFFPGYSQAMESDFHGRVQSRFVLRDTTGFQYGFLDQTKGIQWLNELKFDLTVKPEYEQPPTFRMEKVFLCYRGAYDAIFDLTSRYDGMREKGPTDFELGREDLEYENDLREGFVDLIAETENQSLVVRLGRQIVQWGEADAFNVVNIVNPSDYRNRMFFDNPEELATPLWMGRLNYSRRSLGPFHDVGIELLAVPDIRPTQMAPMDETVNSWWEPDWEYAPYMFGFNQLKQAKLPYMINFVNEKLARIGVANGSELVKLYSVNSLEWPNQYAKLAFGVDTLMYDPPLKVYDDVPGSSLANMEYGVRLQAAYKSFVANLYYFRGWQNDGIIDWTQLARPAGAVWFRHPRQDMWGASFNVFLPSLNAILRGEGCLVDKMGILDITGMYGGIDILFNDLLRKLQRMGIPQILLDRYLGQELPKSSTGWVERKVYQSLLGFDKDLWIRWLNPHKMIGTSWQVYWRHINNWSDDHLTAVFEKSDNFRITGVFYTDYRHGQIHPEIIVMYDPEGVWMTRASIKYSKDGRWYYQLSQISFYGNGGWGWGDHPCETTRSPFVSPFDLTKVSEIAFTIGYNW